MAKATITFGLYQNNQLVARESVSQDVIKVGQDPKSHLCINDPAAARMHAVIEVASVDDVTLIDLGNEIGTFVNGQMVNKCRIGVDDQDSEEGLTRFVATVAEAGCTIFIVHARKALLKGLSPKDMDFINFAARKQH